MSELWYIDIPVRTFVNFEHTSYERKTQMD